MKQIIKAIKEAAIIIAASVAIGFFFGYGFTQGVEQAGWIRVINYNVGE